MSSSLQLSVAMQDKWIGPTRENEALNGPFLSCKNKKVTRLGLEEGRVQVRVEAQLTLHTNSQAAQASVSHSLCINKATS